MTEEQLEEFNKNKVKDRHAESLVWHIGFIKRILEQGVDPQYMLDDLVNRYKNHKDFGEALSNGIEFAEKSYKNDDYKFMDRILKIPYNHGTD